MQRKKIREEKKVKKILEFKHSPQVAEAMKDFHPRFGSREDIEIAELYDDVGRLSILLNDVKEKFKQLKTTEKNCINIQKIVATKTKNLIYLLEQRNKLST
jgi:hypothetical protein